MCNGGVVDGNRVAYEKLYEALHLFSDIARSNVVGGLF